MAGRSSRSNDRAVVSDNFFEPRSLAVIGASSHPEKVGFAVLANVIESGYQGEVFAVNPKAGVIQEIRCHPDVGSLPHPPDLAIVIVPANAVLETVTRCAGIGVRAGVVISAGFRETGIEGRRLENAVVKAARDGGMRLLGPNCLGIINTALPLNASFARRMPPRGSIGVLSQSGAICTSLIDWARAEGVGFSKLVSLGNGADLVESDFLDALADDTKTNVIAMYLEGVSNGERFFESVRRASRAKPVVFFKAGATTSGARAASSHTGSLAGSESSYEALCRQAPALRAYSVDELIELSLALATQPIPKGPSVALITNAGGPGIIASDACERAGLSLARIAGKTLDELKRFLPPAASLHNPIDLLGTADAKLYGLALETLLADPDVDAVMIILTPQAMTEVAGTADEILRIARGAEKPVVCSFMGADSVEAEVDRLQEAGIPNVAYPDKAMQILGRMYERRLQVMRPRPRAKRFPVDSKAVSSLFHGYVETGATTQLSPEDCREVLQAYGIPYSPLKVASDLAGAKRHAAEMGYPVVLKVMSRQVVHKTDVGGVVLDIRNQRRLASAYDDMISNVRRKMPAAKIDGVTVQKMVPQGRELILGVARDPQFGPLVMVGLGGIYVETFKDVAFRLVPMTPRDAASMLHELKAYRLLSGVRGEPPADIAAVEEVLLRVSQLAGEHPCLSEMDINPLIVYNAGDGCTCVDVRITLGG
ncbi:MAG: acetate--CoA ligase family protein [Actinobacteria bacterium]|nr:acetate--CoA ligase family protein [Actinomycetota bacterium]MBU1942973.1 acetate--CoA ligase family protein [Actinomycetota bacterium]MBU2687305.1 acetate--CoA ligase family protein [Actinomycetota bacterium]